MKNMTQTITDNYNAFVGTCIAILSMIFGEHWYLFFLFLMLNVIDYMTGCHKATVLNKKTSEKGWQGIRKKLFYWIMIFFAFLVSAGFIDLGKTIGVDLGITTLLGWFVLASLVVNECRSIVENFVEAGYNVPVILTKGLEVADKMINKDESGKPTQEEK